MTPVAAGPRSVSILGCTGSVGTQTLDLLRAAPERYRVRALVAGSKVALLAQQARDLGAECAVVADPSLYGALRDALAGTNIAVAAGPAAAVEAAAMGADWTMAAITGAAGLPATLAAIKHGKSVALANKEALVCAGDIMLRAVYDAGATLLPVDSEHNAIFQSMADGNHGAIETIVLTASGGPFRTLSREQMTRVGPEDALKHPNWVMGRKITIDSATMFNKGLEVIEAARLFRMPESRIDVLIHPQSVIHGMVRYTDGSILAQLGSPDMRIPIAHTLAWPERIATHANRLDLLALRQLDFEPPDDTRFPAVRLCREALRAGGGAPAILNAANEIAVETFLNGKIGFLDIAGTVERVLDAMGAPPADTLDQVIALDDDARRMATGFTQRRAA
jgi:1-deoxy-D-xylulose-5-phosphate reductoisomerase